MITLDWLSGKEPDFLYSAFGGMVAFCIIVGDTIPHVLAAVFPGLRDMAVLWLLTDRRAVIVLFVLGVSYPLSLYRDIAKVRGVYGFGRDGFERLDWIWTEGLTFFGGGDLVGESIDVGVDQHAGHHRDGYHAGVSGSGGVEGGIKGVVVC